MRAGPKNKPTHKEREDHEATHVQFRDWCTHCMMGRGRTHHHVTKQRSKDQSRRPTIAMDYYFMNSEVFCECSNNVRTISNLHRRQRGPTSEHHEQCCFEKKGVEAPFIDVLGYREITLQSDTEPAFIAFRHRVAENVQSQRTQVQDDTESNGSAENAMMPRTTQWRITNSAVFGGTCRMYLVQRSKKLLRDNAVHKTAWQETRHKNLSHMVIKCWHSKSSQMP